MVEIRLGYDKFHQQREIIEWCDQILGPGKKVWYPPNEWKTNWTWTTGFGSTFFFFRNPRDATIFTLRWV